MIIKVNTTGYTPLSVPIMGTLLLTLQTNASTNAFDPAFTVSYGILKWNLRDLTILDSNSFSHAYVLGGVKNVNVHKGTSDSSILTIDMENDGLVGTLNLSSLFKLNSLILNINPSLNTIINPDVSTTFTVYNVA